MPLALRSRFFPLLICLLSMLGMTSRSGATTVVPPEFSELVNGADYIVRAKVTAIAHEVRTVQGRPTPFTLVTLAVSEVIAGTPPSPLVLTLLGGPIGDDELVINGAPRFSVGDEDILFVSGNGQVVYPLFRMMHGRYPVLKEGARPAGREYMARSNREPLGDTAQVSRPITEPSSAPATTRVAENAGTTGMSPAEFTARIKAERRSR